MTLREVTPDQAHQAVKGQNYKGARVGEGAAMVRGCAAHFGFALVSRGLPGLPFVASCLPPVDHLWPVARSKPGLQTSFLPTPTSSTSSLKET